MDLGIWTEQRIINTVSKRVGNLKGSDGFGGRREGYLEGKHGVIGSQ